MLGRINIKLGEFVYPLDTMLLTYRIGITAVLQIRFSKVNSVVKISTQFDHAYLPHQL